MSFSSYNRCSIRLVFFALIVSANDLVYILGSGSNGCGSGEIWITTGGTAMRIKSPGHAAFAATMIFLGILCLIKGDFSPVWAPVPKGVPAHKMLAYLCGFVSLLCGIGVLWQRTAAVAS